MKAPEEIELNTCTFSDIGLFDIDEEEVTYIRKDALVEWLEERINDGDEEGLMANQIANFAYKDVIDKLNSM